MAIECRLGNAEAFAERSKRQGIEPFLVYELQSLQDVQEAGKSELEKARAKAEKLDSELKAVKAKAAHDEAVAKVAKETGVPASLIKGESEDEMREFAQSVAAYAKPATGARTPRNGEFDNRGTYGADEAKRRLAKQVFGS